MNTDQTNSLSITQPRTAVCPQCGHCPTCGQRRDIGIWHQPQITWQTPQVTSAPRYENIN